MEKKLRQKQSNIIKIALFGPESTGKTTLAKQLAHHFETVWTPEFARDYLQQKWDTNRQICTLEDMLPIAIGQTRLENENLQKANKYLFCDTNLMVTKVFSEIYYDFCDPVLDQAARKHHYDLFFLTDIDVPWEKDDLRDKADGRETVFEVFKRALIDSDKPFITLSGNANARLEKAVLILENREKARAMGFSSADFVQIHDQGTRLENIQKHLKIFKSASPQVVLDRAALIDDGIRKLSDQEFQEFSQLFDAKKTNLKLEKLVPASGAASRMFQFLSEFLNEFDLENESINAYINRKKASQLTIFLTGLKKFPFYKSIDNQLKENFPDFNSWPSDKKNYYFIKFLLESQHFDFRNKPKGILPFHQYASHTVTPIEEHLVESAFYTSSEQGSYLHFTVSEIHQIQFEQIIASIKSKIEWNSGTAIHVSFSHQNKSTDTMAVDLENNPFRDAAGKLVFRPGGHGALIVNLNALDADLVFIKNIDNVIQNQMESIVLYKKALAGIVIQLQEQIFDYLNAIENNSVEESDLEAIASFLQNQLNNPVIEDFAQYTFENKINYIKNRLNRPIRVCGMVKNEGEPGGGPFWVRDATGNFSLQIVETSQIDSQNTHQAQIAARATHFNPVDLVCAIKDFKGIPFDLEAFIDSDAGFIVQKNKNGKELKAYELPGLWNGAMAKWITVFVEVPLITFNPVKTVNDLLKPAHQPQ